MNNKQLEVALRTLKEKNDWLDYEYSELDGGCICFKIKRATKNDSEIYFDNYDRFIDFVSYLGAE